MGVKKGMHWISGANSYIGRSLEAILFWRAGRRQPSHRTTSVVFCGGNSGDFLVRPLVWVHVLYRHNVSACWKERTFSAGKIASNPTCVANFQMGNRDGRSTPENSPLHSAELRFGTTGWGMENAGERPALPIW